MSFPGFALGYQATQNDVAQNKAKEDQQRQAQLGVIANAGLSPEQQRDAIQTLYAKDPSALKQHVGNLIGRMQGKQPQPTPMAYPPQADARYPKGQYPGAATQADRLTQDLAGGTTPQQRQDASIKTREDDIAAREKQQDQQKQQNTIDLIKKYVPREEQQQALQDWTKKQAGIASSLKNIPGAGGQPYQNPNGQWVRPVQGADGSIVEQPLPADWKPPSPKMGVPRPGTVNGKQADGVLTPQGWIDANTGKPLPGFKMAPTYSQIAPSLPAVRAQYETGNVTDDQGEEVVQTRKAIADAARSGNPYLAGAVGAPTGQDKARSVLARSSVQQIDKMEKILDSDPNLTGPGSGQWTAFQQFIGTNSPESQEFLAAATFLSEHGVGVFGGRNIHSIKDLQSLFSSLKTNPAALKAALEQARSTMGTFASAGGRLPGPRVSGFQAFSDSGKTYNIPADKVAAFKKAHPNATASQ